MCATLLLLPCVCLGFWGALYLAVLQKRSWGSCQIRADSCMGLGYPMQGLHSPAEAKKLGFPCRYQARSYGPWPLGFGKMMEGLEAGEKRDPSASSAACLLLCVEPEKL